MTAAPWPASVVGCQDVGELARRLEQLPGRLLIAAVAGEPRLQLVVALDVRRDVEPGGRSQLRRAPQPVLRFARPQPTGDEREHPLKLPHSRRASLAAPRKSSAAIQWPGFASSGAPRLNAIARMTTRLHRVLVGPEDLDVVRAQLAGSVSKGHHRARLGAGLAVGGACGRVDRLEGAELESCPGMDRLARHRPGRPRRSHRTGARAHRLRPPGRR